MAAMGKGGKKTPDRVVELVNKEVDKLGQNAAARAMKLPLYSVQKYMAGIAEPTQASLEKLADYFGVSAWYLRGDSPWTYEQERQLYDWNLLSDDEKARITAAKVKENNDNIARIKGEMDILKASMTALKGEKTKLLSDFERYQELVAAFIHLPVNEMEDAISLLHKVHKLKIES